MFNLAICEISGKQYKIVPNLPVEVSWVGEDKKTIEVPVLLLSEGGKVKIGTPYLKEKLSLECLGTVYADKIRVAKFHAKANFRKVAGSRAKKTKIMYQLLT
ncbi:MAG: bL21 family ribosomal protein [Candidatus Daviesbacteria bacterium]|nr:bL21 family ribosomal protein [Candidatus Daviesbacteria bacterium]